MRGILSIENIPGEFGSEFGAGKLIIPVAAADREATPLFREMADENSQVLTGASTAEQWGQLGYQYMSRQGDFQCNNEGSGGGEWSLIFWRRYLPFNSERKIDHQSKGGAKTALLKGAADFLKGLKEIAPEMTVLPGRLTR